MSSISYYNLRDQNSTKKASGRANSLTTHLIIFIIKLKHSPGRMFLANLIHMLPQVFDNEKFKICIKNLPFEIATQIFFSLEDFRATKRIFLFFVKTHKTHHFCLFGSKLKLSTLLNVLYAACLISYPYLELSLFELAVFYRIIF